MEALYQGSYFCSVKKVQGGELLAETVFLSTAFEAVGRLIVDLTSYRIKEARWDIYRSPENKLIGGDFVPALIGIEAYFSIGQALNRVGNGEGGGLVKDLLAECVRGIIQAETYVYKDRGYASADEYENSWRKDHVNSCRYYSSLHRVINGWFDHVGDYMRDHTLFNRYKSFAVYGQTDGSFLAASSFSDSFHELNVQLSFNGTKGTITDCKGTFLRAPDLVCFENTNHFTSLMGKSVVGISKKEVAKAMGGPNGCFHLVDIVYDTLAAFSAALKK